MRQKVLLVGLQQTTATALEAALPSSDFEVRILPLCDRDCLRAAIAEFAPGVICAPAGAVELRGMLREAGAAIPLIAISGKPNPKEWLQALQDGAADYFGPPFEQRQVGWVLRSAANGSGMRSVLSLTA